VACYRVNFTFTFTVVSEWNQVTLNKLAKKFRAVYVTLSYIIAGSAF